MSLTSAASCITRCDVLPLASAAGAAALQAHDRRSVRSLVGIAYAVSKERTVPYMHRGRQQQLLMPCRAHSLALQHGAATWLSS
jgi:hypothetical protein